MLRRLQGGLGVGLVVGAVLGALLLWLADPRVLQVVRHAQFDQFQRAYPRPYESVGVRVVDIDEDSLKALGQWPWPRTRVAALVRQLQAAGAAVVVLDMLLAEPDRTSPRAMAQLWSDAGEPLAAQLRRLPDPDDALARTLQDGGVVLGMSLARSGRGLGAQAPGFDPPYRVVDAGQGAEVASRWLHGFDEAVWPLPVLGASAAGAGAMNFIDDNEGVLRRVPLLLRVGERRVPTLATEALRVAQGARNLLIRSNEAGVQDLRIGQVTVPTTAQGEIWLHYSRHEPMRTVSALQVWQGRVPPQQLQGHIVLVGTSSAGLSDLRFNPQGRLMPGVEVHAQALEQMLQGHHLTRPGWTAAVEAFALVACGLLAGGVALAGAAWLSALTAGVLLAGLLGGAWQLFVSQRLLLDATTPALVVVCCFVLGSGTHHVLSERKQRWLRQAFSRYVSPNRVAYLVDHPEQLELGGRRQVCSFVFTDLAGFTNLLEAMDPGRAVSLLNEYLEALISIVFRHEGTIDRIVGDAVVVMFSAPVEQADHAQRALDCALEMDAFAAAYARRLQTLGVNWGQTRIGVHCGEVIVGNFGGQALFDYRALGDPINTAARLESVNKHLGTRVCVSRDILDACRGVAVRPVGRLVLKGKKRPLQVYEPLAAAQSPEYAPLAPYQEAIECLQGPTPSADQVLAAAEQFEALAQHHPNDPLVALHVKRLREGYSNDLIVMTEK